MTRLGRKGGVGGLLVGGVEEDAGDGAERRRAALDGQHAAGHEELARADDEIRGAALLVPGRQEVAGELREFGEPLVGVRDPADPLERVVAVRQVLELERREPGRRQLAAAGQP